MYKRQGIESPGLSSAPAIGERVAAIVERLFKPSKNADFIETRKGILNPKDVYKRQSFNKSMYIFSIKLEDFMEHLVFTLVTFVLFTALVGIISGKIVKNSDEMCIRDRYL